MKKRILVAPLNWGLGHATRCIPIINALIQQNFEPVIASDGDALKLLHKEFPKLKYLELPAYNIAYSKTGSGLKWKLLKQSPHIARTIKLEQASTQHILETYNIKGIISDNRFGVLSKEVPSVFITHQLQVLSGSTTWLSTAIHNNILKKFDECWVPDYEGKLNLSGKLGHAKRSEINLKYIGPLSRFNQQEFNPEFDILVLISGPEPQRSLLQDKLLQVFENYIGKVVFVLGLIEDKQLITKKKHITVYNYMTSRELESTIQKSKVVVTRSGYTSIMDLAKLNKACFFIPTPGQFEQEYLAKRLTEINLVPSCSQNTFTIEKLKEIKTYKGFRGFKFDLDYEKLFKLFEGE